MADDLAAAAERLESCQLWVHLIDAGQEDQIEITFNGTGLACVNPLVPGQQDSPIWLCYEPSPELVRGANEVGIRLLSRGNLPDQVQDDEPLEVADVELEIRYFFPDGKGSIPRGYVPRT